MTTLTPSYMVNRQPLKYGGQQKDYQQRLSALINWGSNQIKEAPREEVELGKLFYRMLEHFSQERQKIAVGHYTKDADQFGCRRDVDGTRDFYITILDQEYQEYNSKILAILSEHLRGMSLDKKESVQKNKKIEAADHSSSLEIEILENHDLLNLKWVCPLAKEDFPADYPMELFQKREKGNKLTSHEFDILKVFRKKIKETNPVLHKRCKMISVLENLNVSVKYNHLSFFS